VAFGYGVADKSCYGSGVGCRFAQAPGYIVNWKTKTAPDGSEVSDVEPVDDEEVREKIDGMEMYCQINFD